MRYLLLPLLAAPMLSGCVHRIAENRVESALRDAGLSERNASCMADRMVDRLSISQLRKLEELKPRTGEKAIPASLSQFMERVRRVGDREVLAVTASSAAMCATGLGQS